MTAPVNVTPETVAEAARILRAGGLVAFPTETVYGLGADATNGEAVARIFEAKGRPRFNPLIVHVPSLVEARRLAVFNAEVELLARAFWPGPLTLVMQRHEYAGLSDLVSAGLPTVAVRCPAHPVAQEVIRAAGVPVAAPSANRSGQVSATTAAHVAADFGDRLDMILDDGPATAGIESTIVGLHGPVPMLLRAGAVAREEIEALLGRPLATPHAGGPAQAPGMLTSHYAPRAALRLNAVEPLAGDAYLAFGTMPDCVVASLNLSPARNLREAAANLFAYLRALDATGAPTIAVAPIPEEGLGEAINDRLRRAAAPRDAR
jgi:L-threonylcarbamoyladenylate synthase